MPTVDLSSYHQNAGTTSDGAKFNNLIDAVQAAVNALDNNNIAAGAGIVASKLGQSSAATGQALVWSGSAWVPATITTTYRKTTAKTVNTTVAETDLLNGEITLAASDMGTNRRLRLHARGDWKNNSGGAADLPRFKVKLGATTLIDTSVPGASTAASNAGRQPWQVDVDIAELGATNAQWINFLMTLGYFGNAVGPNAAFATGTGVYTATSGSTQAVGFAYGSNTGAVDTTSSLALVLSVINASANANYEVVLKDALVVIE